MSIASVASNASINPTCVNLCLRCLVEKESPNDEITFKSPIHCGSCHSNFQTDQVVVHAAIVQALIERDDELLLQVATSSQYAQSTDGRMRGITLTICVPTPCSNALCSAVIEAVHVRVVCDVDQIDSHVIATNVTSIEVIDPRSSVITPSLSSASNVTSARSSTDLMSSAITAASGAFNSMKSMLYRPAINHELLADGLLIGPDECKKMFFALLGSAERNVQLHIQSLNDFSTMQAILYQVQREIPMQIVVNACLNTEQTRPFLHSLSNSCVNVRVQSTPGSSGIMMLIVDNQRVLSGHFSCDDEMLNDTPGEEEISLVLCSELDVVKAFQMKFIQTLLHESDSLEHKAPVITDSIVISHDTSPSHVADDTTVSSKQTDAVEPAITHFNPVILYGSHEDNIHGQLPMSHLFAAIRDARSTIHVIISVLTLDLAVMLRSSHQSVQVSILADDSTSNREVWRRIELYGDQPTSRERVVCHFVAGSSSRVYDDVTKAWVVTRAPMRECLIVIDGNQEQSMVITGSALYANNTNKTGQIDENDDYEDDDDTEPEQPFEHLLFLPIHSFAQACLKRFSRIKSVNDDFRNERSWNAIGTVDEFVHFGESNQSVFGV